MHQTESMTEFRAAGNQDPRPAKRTKSMDMQPPRTWLIEPFATSRSRPVRRDKLKVLSLS